MRSLFTIKRPNAIIPENEPDVEEREYVSAHKAIQMEKEASKLKSERRNETFENIIYNVSTEYKSPKYIFYGVIGILPALSLKWFYTLIPVHNLILMPQYWY